MTLLELQRQMEADVRRPLTSDYEMQRTMGDGSSMEEHAATYIKPGPQLASFERLEIYNRQYWFRVIGAVSEDFPAVRAVLGESRFDALILAYLREHPSISWSLRDLGAGLLDFLLRNPRLAGRRHRLACDVVRLEWAYVEAFDRGHRPALTEGDLQTLHAESRLMLQPHLQLLSLDYPADELVLAVRHQTPESEMASNAAAARSTAATCDIPKIKPEPCYLAVHRFENSVYYRRLERERFLLLQALRDDFTIAEAIASAFAASHLTPEQQATMTQDCFAHAAEMGWFCQKGE